MHLTFEVATISKTLLALKALANFLQLFCPVCGIPQHTPGSDCASRRCAPIPLGSCWGISSTTQRVCVARRAPAVRNQSSCVQRHIQDGSA
eukprot:5811668-Alexandrium_andersonii.AAC.1